MKEAVDRSLQPSVASRLSGLCGPWAEVLSDGERLTAFVRAGHDAAKLIRRQQAALQELRELFEDRQDIDNNGGPNDAMRAVQIIDAVIKEAESET